MNKQEKNTRIRLICEFLNKGGGKINEMETSVNQQLTDHGQKEIGRRTLVTCLTCLRKGDFDHSLKNKLTSICPGGVFGDALDKKEKTSNRFFINRIATGHNLNYHVVHCFIKSVGNVN